MNLILYAIPGFFALILAELAVDKLRNTGYYRINDSVNSLTIGVFSRIAGLAKAAVPIAMYPLALEYLALMQWEQTWVLWVVAFAVYDFCYYWNHRMGHEVNFFWASHVVHHSSEEYNLTTALRQTSTSVLGWIFYLPLALMGVPLEVFISVAALNLIYQFWVHTRHVPKLGWFEWCFVTPSNHRVHHAQNQIYIDKNYGGVFILWDRIFGTFQEELDDEPVIFGIRKALKSWNPLWANFHVISQLCKDSWHTARYRDKLKVWFAKTGWRPDDVNSRFPIPRADMANFKKFDIALNGMERFYALIQHIQTLLITLLFLLNVATLSVASLWGVSLFILFSGVSLAIFMERKAWGVGLEAAKNAAVLVLLSQVALPFWLALTLAFFSCLGLVLLWRVTRSQQLAAG